MRLVYISLGVLGVHLAVLGWLQVRQPEAQPPLVLAPVQTRQIPAQPALAPPPTNSARDQPLRRPERARREQLQRPESPPPAVLSAVASPKIPDSSAAVPVADDSSPVVGAGKPLASTAASGVTPATAQVASSKGMTLPSSMADYLSNPPPNYPPLSLRLNEQGTVVVRVLIGKNGRALDARLAQSSGFDRLDQAALRAVLSWRYVPGTVDGQAQDMWFDVPVNFKSPR